jgi:SecD/SecF fusion protein
VPDRDPTLDMLRELRDVGLTPPRAEELDPRVSSAIAQEIERERHLQQGGLNGASTAPSTDERFGGAHRRRGFGRLGGALVPVVGVLVVALVVGVFVGLHRSGPSSTSPSHGSVRSSHGSVQLVYLAEPSAQVPVVTRVALERTVLVMQERLRALGIGGAHVSVSGAKEITVVLPNVRNTAQAEREVGATSQLAFYDWEANALTPNGKSVANQLLAHNPTTAIEISQGSGPMSPGSPGAGSMPVYQAVQLASKQHGWSSSANSRTGPQYWMFGSPGSAACAAAARDQGTVPVVGQHCLLSGPDDNLTDLRAGLPSGVSASEGQTLTIPRGWVVLQAIPADFSHPTPIGYPTPIGSASAQFYVLRDNIALRGSDIANPQQSTEPNTGTPNITFGFNAKGKTEFQNVTAAIARRGELVSGLGQPVNQHFAVALDNQLITVPYIDYKQYPDGINGDQGADISGSFTKTSAQDLANELRLGALPLNLNLICEGAPATTPCRRPRIR